MPWLRTVSGERVVVSLLRVTCFFAHPLCANSTCIYTVALDYIKAQMQTETGKAKYKNGLDVLSQTLSTNPLLLFKGVGIQILGVSPKNGIRLGVNDFIRGTFMGYCGYFPLWGEVVAGSLAGACQVHSDWTECTSHECLYMWHFSHSLSSIT